MAPRARKRAENLLPSEVAEQRATAEAAGYVNPFPAPGRAIVTTIDDRCPACHRTLFVSMQNEVWCPYERCTEHRISYQEVSDGEPVPVG